MENVDTSSRKQVIVSGSELYRDYAIQSGCVWNEDILYVTAVEELSVRRRWK